MPGLITPHDLITERMDKTMTVAIGLSETWQIIGSPGAGLAIRIWGWGGSLWTTSIGRVIIFARDGMAGTFRENLGLSDEDPSDHIIIPGGRRIPSSIGTVNITAVADTLGQRIIFWAMYTAEDN